jgi:autotransporter-associated beta strand protein
MFLLNSFRGWFERKSRPIVKNSEAPCHNRIRLCFETLEDRIVPTNTALGVALDLGGAGNDYGEAAATDAHGNVYVTGAFSGTVNFNPAGTATYLTNHGFTVECFVAKYSPTGVLDWAEVLGDNANFSEGLGIAVDGSGNVFTTGGYEGTANFNPNGTFDLTSTPTNKENGDAFVSKLDTNGNFVWADDLGGGSNYTYGQGIAVDSSDNVYTTGYFFGIGNFNPNGTYDLTSTSSPEGNNNAYVSKLDSNGHFVWAGILGAGSARAEGFGIAVDGSGDVYTTGYFAGTGNFDINGTHDLAGALTHNNAYVSKLDTNGNFQWADILAAGANAQGYGIALDGSGNIYSTGFFNGTGNFDPFGTHDLTSTSTPSSQDNAYVSKLDSNGHFVWDADLGAGGTADGYAITLDGKGNVYTTGSFNGTANFDPSGTHTLTSVVSYQDTYVSILNGSGNFVGDAELGASSSETTGQGIAVDGSGDIFVTGNFENTGNFDPNGTYYLSSFSGTEDAFLTALTQPRPFEYAVSSHPSITSVKLLAQNNHLEIVDSNNPSDILQSQPLQNVSTVDITGTVGGGNTLTIDYSGGLFSPTIPVAFHGGPGPNNTLKIILPPGIPKVVDTLTGPGQGTIEYAGQTSGDTSYDGLQPVILSGTAADVVLTLANSNVTDAVLEAGATPGTTALHFTNGSNEDVTFNNPSDSLEIDTQGGSQVQIAAQDNGFAPANIVFNGQATDRFNLATGVLPTASNLVLTGATFDLNGNSDTISSLNGNGIVTNTGSAAALTVDSGGNFNGSITGSNTGLTVAGTAQTLTLSGTDSYGGVTNINSSDTLSAGSGSALSPPSSVNDSGILDLGGFSNSIASLSGAGVVTNTAAAGTAILSANNGGDFSGSFNDGNGGAQTALTLGGGTFVLTGTSTYSGATSVNSGILQVDGSIASSVSVAGGTLEGTGTTGPVTADTGTVAPGDDPGVLTTGSLSFMSGSSFNVAIGGNSAGTGSGHYSQDNVKGAASTVNLDGATLNLSTFGGYVPQLGDQYFIINNGGTSAVSGTFMGLAEGAAISNFLGTTLTAHITYKGGDGNDVVITLPSAPSITPTDFSNLSSPTITYGTTMTNITGDLQAGGQLVPAGETVKVTLNGVTDNATLLGDDSFSASFGTSALDVGGSPYMIGFGYAGDSNFASAVGTSTLTVTPASQTIAFSVSSPVTYGVSPIPLSATGGASGNPVTFSVVSGSGTVNSNVLTVTGAGNIVIEADQAGSVDYASASVQANLNVARKPASVTPIAASKTYGDQDPTLTGTLSGFLAADNITATYSRNAGENVTTSPYTITATLSPAGVLGNYLVTFNTAPFTINTAPLTITATTFSRPYDTTVNAAAVPTVAGLKGNDKVSGLSEAFDTKKVGINKTLSVASYTVNDGNSGNNYAVMLVANSTGQITARSLTVTATGQNKTYDGTSNATVTLADNHLAGDVVNDSYALASFADPNVGVSKPVSVSGIGIGGSDSGNYVLTSTIASTTANIAQATTKTVLQVSASSITTAQSLTLTATVSLLTGAGTIVGSVNFQSGSTPLGTATVGSGGVATLTLPAGSLSPATYSITATFAGSTNFQASAPSAAVSVQVTSTSGQPPKVGIAGPSSGVRGQCLTFTFTATDTSAAPLAAGFTYSINWGDGSPIQVIAATANNGSGVALSHTFAASSSFTVSATATDYHGLVSAAQKWSVAVAAYAVEADPVSQGKFDLVIGGTTGNDVIAVTPGSTSSTVVVTINCVSNSVIVKGSPLPGPVSRIIIYTQSGNDVAAVDARVTLDAEIYGGSGKDVLQGGGGNNILVGGGGNNVLVAGKGRDILIGGSGSSALFGASSDDILVGGNTAFDHNEAALRAIQAEWESSQSYGMRENNLLGSQLTSNRLNGNYFLNAGTVYADTGHDALTGGLGMDWFLADTIGTTARDVVFSSYGEIITQIGPR